MKRVTKEKVFDAATEVVKTGETPTINRIREVLGGGSKTSIAPLLREWLFEEEKKRVARDSCPPELIDRYVTEATQLFVAGREEGLQQSVMTIDEYMAKIDSCQEDIDLTANQLDEVLTENEKLESKVKEQGAQIIDQKAELKSLKILEERAREETLELRDELTKCKENLSSLKSEIRVLKAPNSN